VGLVEDYSYFMVRLPVHPEARAASAAVAKATADVGTESALSRHQVEILHKCADDTAIGDLKEIDSIHDDLPNPR
jgi:ATP-dependent DNA helicase RecG